MIVCVCTHPPADHAGMGLRTTACCAMGCRCAGYLGAINPLPIDRAALTAHVTFRLPELTDDALSQLAAFVDGLDRRPLTPEALNAAQRAREAESGTLADLDRELHALSSGAP